MLDEKGIFDFTFHGGAINFEADAGDLVRIECTDSLGLPATYQVTASDGQTRFDFTSFDVDWNESAVFYMDKNQTNYDDGAVPNDGIFTFTFGEPLIGGEVIRVAGTNTAGDGITVGTITAIGGQTEFDFSSFDIDWTQLDYTFHMESVYTFKPDALNVSSRLETGAND